MCYAIPGKIVAIKKDIAVVDYNGEQRNVLIDASDIDMGDYVYAQGGMIVQKIDEREAHLVLGIWKNKLAKLNEIDARIASSQESRVTNKKFKKIIEKAKMGTLLARDELSYLLETNDAKERELLYKTANKIRQQCLKNSSCVHGIIEFSNHCRNNCHYCGIRSDNRGLKRYRMTSDEIVALAEYAVKKLKFKALVLQAGEDGWYTAEKLVEIISRIKERCGVLLFMSIGERSKECYRKMYEAGARGVLLRFETSNPSIYREMHAGQKADFTRRINILRDAKKMGYLIATGSLVGLPKQTEDDLVNDIVLTASLQAEMYSYGPLIPHPDTPLADNPQVPLHMMLKMIAVTRLANPDAKILVTTALETLDKKNGKRLGLLAGANSLMINLTPRHYRECYAIYPSRAGTDATVEASIRETLGVLYKLGRAPTDIGR